MIIMLQAMLQAFFDRTRVWFWFPLWPWGPGAFLAMALRCPKRGRWQVKAAPKLEAPPVEESLEDQEEGSWPGLFDSLLVVVVMMF